MSNDTTETTALETVVDAYLADLERDRRRQAGRAHRAVAGGRPLVPRPDAGGRWPGGLRRHDRRRAGPDARSRDAAAPARSTPTATWPASTGRSVCRARRRRSPASTSSRPTPTASCTASSASPATRSPPPDGEPRPCRRPSPPRGRRPAALGSSRGRECSERRRDVAGLAGGPSSEPDGPGDRRRGVHPTSQLRGDREVQAVAGAGVGPRRAPRRPSPGAQLDAARCRVRPPVPADAARRRVDGERARRARRADPGPRPVPGGRRRSRLGRRHDEHRRPGVPRRREPASCWPAAR